MNIKEWLGYGLYKKLWSLIGKRPWTYIRRDFWHRFEIVNIVFFVSVGFWAGFFYPRIYYWMTEHWWSLILLVAVFYFIGVLQGHFYWGSKYIKNQGG